MKALFFGSIGTLVETSELQRASFNRAFAEHGLPWHWDRDLYRDMLGASGGKARIEQFAERHGTIVDADAIHARKVALFHEGLAREKLPARPGVVETLTEAKDRGLTLAVVSTTDKLSLDLALDNAAGLSVDAFDLVTSADLELSQKPSPAPYRHALDALTLKPGDAVAIEDNRPGVQSAKAAGIGVIAFPGANTMTHDYSLADTVVTDDLKTAIFG